MSSYLEARSFLVVVVLVERIGHGNDVVDDFGSPESGVGGLCGEEAYDGGAEVDAEVVGASGVLRARAARRRRRVLTFYRRHGRPHARLIHYILVRSQFR